MKNPTSFVRFHLLTGLLACAIAAAPAVLNAASDHDHHSEGPKAALAVLVSGSGSNVKGTIKFTQEANGVRVEANVEGLTPGQHGFHVHEHGDLSKPDLTSAGGHFNPGKHKHAGRDAAERHIGDLGNLEAGADGRATASFVDPHLKLHGAHSILGRAVIIHAKADDLKSQPTGDAGGRVAGGVIGIAAPAAK